MCACYAFQNATYALHAVQAAETLCNPDHRRDYEAMLSRLEFEARLVNERGSGADRFWGLFGAASVGQQHGKGLLWWG